MYAPIELGILLNFVHVFLLESIFMSILYMP